MLRPAEGDCCVFCTYADVPCPPIQRARVAKGTSQERIARREQHLG
jgi:hypothetical protein